MLVHRLLDVVFRTLDAIDAVRARVDAVLGHDAQPPSSWSPDAPAAPSKTPPAAEVPPPVLATDGSRSSPSSTPPDQRDQRADVARPSSTTKRPRTAARSTRLAPDVSAATSSLAKASPTKASAAKASPTKASAAKASPAKASAAKASAAKASAAKGSAAGVGATKPGAAEAGATKPAGAEARGGAGAGRKGSVDRSGRDLDSPRARAIATWLKESGRPLIAADATLDGKRTLARVLWAVACAEDAGSEQGLTAADASAFLSSAAGLEVFTTNVGRALRDEPGLFVETFPDRRSKRYKLTQAGRMRLTEVRMR